MSSGDDGKAEGMGRAERCANPAWKVEATRAVVQAAQLYPTLTTDDVVLLIPPNIRTHENRALGPIMKNCAREGWIEKDTAPNVNCATRPNNHSRPLQVWRSLLFRRSKSAKTP
jgi:hypothetical protein